MAPMLCRCCAREANTALTLWSRLGRTSRRDALTRQPHVLELALATETELNEQSAAALTHLDDPTRWSCHTSASSCLGGNQRPPDTFPNSRNAAPLPLGGSLVSGNTTRPPYIHEGLCKRDSPDVGKAAAQVGAVSLRRQQPTKPAGCLRISTHCVLTCRPG